MISNKDVKGRAVFSDEEQIKERSLKIYTYLVCKSGLKDGYSHVRIFQQKDINLSEIKRTFHMDERTIKKYWEELEKEGLIRYNPFTPENMDLSFTERWKIRNKNKTTYYEIPTPPKFRKIPKETLLELNDKDKGISELAFKVYLILINYQESCILNGKTYKPFTYEDLRTLLGYGMHHDIHNKLEKALLNLREIGLIEFNKDSMLNKFGVEIPVFKLIQANFYTNYDIKDFEPAQECVIEEQQREDIKNGMKEHGSLEKI